MYPESLTGIFCGIRVLDLLHNCLSLLTPGVFLGNVWLYQKVYLMKQHIFSFYNPLRCGKMERYQNSFGSLHVTVQGREKEEL